MRASRSMGLESGRLSPPTKFGVRAAMCLDETTARYSREHNGANVLCLGATLLPGVEAALRIVDVWLGTPMREARYIRRLVKIRRLEDQP